MLQPYMLAAPMCCPLSTHQYYFAQQPPLSYCILPSRTSSTTHACAPPQHPCTVHPPVGTVLLNIIAATPAVKVAPLCHCLTT
jgi:hypothetical protein